MDDQQKPSIDKNTRISATENSEIKSGKNIPDKDRPDRNAESKLTFDYVPFEDMPFTMDGRKNSRLRVEKRTYSRKTCFFPVNYATSDRAFQEFIQDISNSGAFVETKHLLPEGQTISITFSLPGSDKNIKMKGCIARTTSKGIGIAFNLESDEQKEYMASYLPEV